MSTISTAVGVDRISRVSGYNVKRGVFTTDTQNLPQIIAVFGEANMANQMGLTTAKREVTSAEEAAELYGYGSPIHSQMRILRPLSGEGVGGIPTIVFPQITDGDSSPTVRTWEVQGAATANTTHYIVVNGRTSLDFKPYSFDVKVGDSASTIATKIVDAINSVISAPCYANKPRPTEIDFTTKWAGTTSTEFNISIIYGEPGFNNPISAGIAYVLSDSIDGAGSVDLADSLEQFGDDWYTMVTNPYGLDQLSILEQFNGLPNDINPTGRYSGLNFKPFCAYFGSTLIDKDDLVDITDDAARIGQVTNVLCPAPASLGFSWEAVANVVSLAAFVYQNNPNLDVNNLSYPDMPTPIGGDIGDMKNYNNRDFLVKKGCSTVMLKNGAYVVQDLVTTYHPEGEIPLQYAYPRNLNIDWNVADSYKTFERLYLQDKTLVLDNQIVDVDGCIKPKEWKGLVYELFDNIAEKALINDPEFSKTSMVVNISTLNPNRFETTFKYKRTGIARIESTTASAGF
jgi:phage tail sheath gpL-like